MKSFLLFGVLVAIFGLIGLSLCILQGVKIKRLERLGNHSPEELKKMLGRAYLLNMLGLFCAFLGLLIVTITLIFDN